MNYNIDELIKQIKNKDYLEKLILKKATNESHEYPTEWYNLLNEIDKICNMSETRGEQIPFTEEDFVYFLDGTVAELLKKSISETKNTNYYKYEIAKIDKLFLLPKEVKMVMFTQNDLLDAIELLGQFAEPVIESISNREGFILGNSFYNRSFELERNLENYEDEIKFFKGRLEKLSRDKEISIRTGTFDINKHKKIIEEIKEKIEELENLVHNLYFRKKTCQEYGKQALNRSTNLNLIDAKDKLSFSSKKNLK